MLIGTAGTGKLGKRYHYYACQQKLKKQCTKKSIRRDVLDDIVITKCREVLTSENIATISKAVSALVEKEANNPYVSQLKKSISQTDKAIENLLKSLEAGEATATISSRLAEREQEKIDLEDQLRKEELVTKLLSEPEILFFLTELQAGNIDDKKYRKMLVSTLINKIYLFDDKLIIYFNATDKESVEITNEMRKEVESQIEGSHETAMAED